MMKKFTLAFVAVLLLAVTVQAQDAETLLAAVRQKLERVNNYTADGTLKTNVTFLKVPVSSVKIFYKRPDKIKIKSSKGMSFVPKGAVNINLNQLLLTNNYTTVDAGSEKSGQKALRVIRLLPNDENSDVVLSTLYIDAQTSLVNKAKVTTRENGTYELQMDYGKYAELGLPDKILFSFNTRNYKLPKGVTFDFDDGTAAPAKPSAQKDKKGRAEIVIKTYAINKGVPDAEFK